MRFGFSHVGLIYLFMLMLPNVIWTKNQPKDYEKYVGNENKVLLVMERIGGVLVSFNINSWLEWSWCLAASFVLKILYEIFWIRYFKSEKTMRDFYENGSFTGCIMAM